MHDFEVRYLDIVFSKPLTAIKISASSDFVEITEEAGSLHASTTTFPKTNFHIGIQLKNKNPLHQPYVILPDGSHEQLIPITDPATSRVWWIHNGRWDKKTKRHYSELYRTAGRVNLRIEDKTLIIQNGTFNFSVEELEYYLSDFKNNLWMLILDDSSAARAGVEKEVPDCFNSEVSSLFHDFVSSVEKVLKKPNMRLVESQGEAPIRKLRPVTKTFREFAYKPNAKHLTSRIYQESFDTPENRFIHYCVKRLLFLLKGLLRISEGQILSLQKRIEQEVNFQKTHLHSDSKKVDKQVYDNEIRKLSAQIAFVDDQLAELYLLVSIEHFEYSETIGPVEISFDVGKKYGNSQNKFFANYIDVSPYVVFDGDYYVVEFPACPRDSKIYSSIEYGSMHVSGTLHLKRCRAYSGKSFALFSFSGVSQIRMTKSRSIDELVRLKQQRMNYEESNWITSLTKDEVAEHQIENRVSNRKLELFQQQVSHLESFQKNIPHVLKRLSRIGNFFREARVKVHAECPNSMVFIQNPFYASAKSIYSKINGLQGMDEDNLNSLILIDDIGLVSISNLYEKWCLLQIIKSLSHTFNYQIEDGWQKKLIETVLDNRVNIELLFRDDSRQQRISLTYEKILQSGKRPDFVIDLTSNTYSYEGSWKITGAEKKRLVIDAKFRGDISEDQLAMEVLGLYDGKDYSEGETNKVFIIHPTPNLIKNQRSSPLIWGNQSDYGQSDAVNHRFGSIFVSPSLRFPRSLDNLQRLLGMFLQENGQILKDPDSAMLWHNNTCISCGESGVENLRHTYESTKAGRDRWVIECLNCKTRTIKTVCLSCSRTLYKNGPKWTYHRTRAEQTSNVVCPACETFL